MAMQAMTKPTLSRRWETYTATKTTVFWACALAVAATIVVGFYWGGWVTGGSARVMSVTAGDKARGELASTICVERFRAAPDAAEKLAAFKAIPEEYKKREFIEKGGWAVMPGQTSSDRLGVQGCATTLAA